MWSLSPLLLATAALAQYSSPGNSSTSLGPDEHGKYEISAEGIRGLFIPYGASSVNLLPMRTACAYCFTELPTCLSRARMARSVT